MVRNGRAKTDVISQISEHTGTALHGTGINKNTLNYKGFYNGEKFFAEMNIIGLQEVPGLYLFLPKFLKDQLQ